MKKNYDIGIVGCWYWVNYGSLLNGYATFSILKSLGLSPLNIVTPNNSFENHAKKLFEIVYNNDEISDVLPFDQVEQYNNICGQFLNGSDQLWKFDPRKDNRKYDRFFKLDFVDDSKNKISFSTSFGRYTPEPPDIRADSEMLLKRYTAISVREQQSVDILAQAYGIQGTRILEPVFDITRDKWDELAEHSSYNETEPYVLTYILDPTPEKKKAIEFYSKKLGFKAINILDGYSRTYQKNKDALNLPNTLPNIAAYDFLKYYRNAKFVITDSFHGVCFSVIYNKPFIAVQNIARGVERFRTLLNMLDMSDRLVSDTEIPLDEKLLYHLDFTNANKIIEDERNRAIEWLKNAVNLPQGTKVQHIKRQINTVLPKEDCMGCGACVSVCPVMAIDLVPDEYGVYRSKVNVEKCVDCQKCKNVCAAIELPKNLNSSKPIAYAFITGDKDELMSCASGGAGTVLAKTAIDNGGIVVGAAWKDDFTVEHIIVEKKEELDKFKKSKYFQSYMGDTCKKIKEVLDTSKFLMFVGTPCQVAGVRKYLGKNYNNLLLVDLLCANCPSAGLFKKYLGEKYDLSQLKSYSFRYKYDENEGNRSSFIQFKSGETEIIQVNSDDYLKVFHTCSPSLSSQCLKCNYQGSTRAGDLTIGDCWGIENYDNSIDSSKGVSVILINNTKGQDFVEKIPKEYIGVLKEEPLDMIKKYNVVAFAEKRNWPNTLRRRVFHEEVLKGTYHEAKEKSINIPKGKM